MATLIKYTEPSCAKIVFSTILHIGEQDRQCHVEAENWGEAWHVTLVRPRGIEPVDPAVVMYDNRNWSKIAKEIPELIGSRK